MIIKEVLWIELYVIESCPDAPIIIRLSDTKCRSSIKGPSVVILLYLLLSASRHTKWPGKVAQWLAAAQQ